MAMSRHTPLPLWALVTLVLVVVSPVTPQPIRARRWAKTGELEVLKVRGLREALAEAEKIQKFQPSPAEHIVPPTHMKIYHDNIFHEPNAPGHLSKREPSSDESIVSVIVPVAPASDYLPYSHDRPTTDKQDISITESKNIVPQRLNHYGGIFNDQEKDVDGDLGPRTESYMFSTFQISPTHYISFFSYRISFPFLKFAPKCLPRLRLPGILTTVMLLLALIWVAILTIALVELGNYMWKKRRAAKLAVESDQIVSERIPSACEDGKIPLETLSLVLGPEETESYVENASLMSDSSLDSGSDSEPDVEDYRIF